MQCSRGKTAEPPHWKGSYPDYPVFEEPVPYALLTLLFTFQYYTLPPSLQDSLQARSYASKVKEKLKQMLNECFQVQGGHG